MKSKIIKHEAFSIYEFLVVFFIIGLVAAITLPTISNYSPSWKISTNSKLVLNKLRQAQEEAVAIQDQHAVRFDPSANPPTVQLVNITGTETIIDSKTFDGGITLEIDGVFTDNEIIFSADGGPSASGNIVVNYSDRSKTINVSPSGVIKLLQ